MSSISSSLKQTNQRRLEAERTVKQSLLRSETQGLSSSNNTTTIAPTVQASTEGYLFDRDYPRENEGRGARFLKDDDFYDAARVDTENSEIDPKDGNKYEFDTFKSSQYDCCSLKLDDRDRMLIPYDSVVNRAIKGFFNPCSHKCGRLTTVAHLIWTLNFLAFVAHFTAAFVTLFLAFWRHGLSIHDSDHVSVAIYRFSCVPTQSEINMNISSWKVGVDDDTRNFIRNDGFVRKTVTEINLALLTFAFFMTSAISHFLFCVGFAMPRLWRWTWRQIDDAFCYWRWIEYFFSASIMAVQIGIIVGIREANILALIFICHATCMSFGFLTEYVSTPKISKDEKKYEFTIRDRKINTAPDYDNDSHALKIINGDEWSNDRRNPTALAQNQRKPRFITSQRNLNYLRRIVPNLCGFVPFVGSWTVIFVAWDETRNDISKLVRSDGSPIEIPEWVDMLVAGLFVIFLSFSFVQLHFQALPPKYYSGAELCYVILSLTAKLYLGIFCLYNVLSVNP